MTTQLSGKQAYLAMYAFLLAEYERSPSEVLAVLLGGMSLLPGGRTADPAVETDWDDACRAAVDGRVDASLRLK
jgi:hypothetical protein